MVKLKVEVTQEDICCGIRGQPTSCPIARSLSRKGFDPVVVFSEVCLYKRGHWDNITAKLPEVASDFAMRFDCGEPVAPITFELEFINCNLADINDYGEPFKDTTNLIEKQMLLEEVKNV